MFEDVGNKIKKLAKVIFFLLAIAIVNIGVYIYGNPSFSNNNHNAAIITAIAIFIAILLSWIFSLFIYAFGELVDKTSKNEAHARNNNVLLSDINQALIFLTPKLSKQSDPTSNSHEHFTCETCNNRNNCQHANCDQSKP